MSLNCNLLIPEVEGLASQQLTVGRHFILQCNGEIPSDFNFSQAQIVKSEENKYEFSLSKIERTSSSEVVLDLVSYLTGDLPSQEMTISDGAQQFTLSFTKIKVDSVLKTDGSTEKPPEPYGFVVSSLPWPTGYTVFFVILFCAIFAFMIQQFIKRKRLRRLVRQLEDYNSALSPDSQFYKHIRLLEKQNYPIAEIEHQFKIYVIRKYQVPLFGMTLSEAMNFIKKKWPGFTEERRELKNILLDLKKMNENSTPEENKLYLKKLYQFVDRSEEKMGVAP